MENSRILYYDWLRIFAIFTVVLLHVAASDWQYFDVNTTEWFVLDVYSGVVRWSVPVFVMISGALFLSRDIPVKKIYTKYALRLFIAFVVWSFAYFLFDGESVSSQFLSLFSAQKYEQLVSLIDGHFHLWFVAMLSGIYLCIPVIKKIVENEKIGRYFLLLSFVFAFLIPWIAHLAEDFAGEPLKSIVYALYCDVGNMNLAFVSSYIFYFILGYYLSKMKLNKPQKLILYALGLCGILFTFLADRAVSLNLQTTVLTYSDGFCVNICVASAAVFELFKNLSFQKLGGSRLLQKLSKWCFGVYLVHPLLIQLLKDIFGISVLSSSLPVALAVPLIALAVFVAACVISAILNCIPFLKKYIV